jgi:ABC-type transport system substrate-binding protein
MSPRNRKLLAWSVALGVAIGLGVASAQPPDAQSAVRSEGATVQDRGTLVLGSLFFEFIDPALVPDPTSAYAISSVLAAWAVEDATCAMLLRYPVGAPTKPDYSLVPEVAAGYPEVSPDGRTYTFLIRPGFRFSDGAPVTAANYARAIKRVLDPRMHSPAEKYLHEVVGVTAASNRLVVRLAKRVPDFPARMTMPYLCPVPKDMPIAPEGVRAALPGSGPYYVSEFVPAKQVVLKRNPFYRDRRPHHVDQFVVQVGEDSVAFSRKVEAGNADVDLNVPLSRLDELGSKYTVNKNQLFAIPSANVSYLFMNTERPLFRRNVRLRKAVSLAIDRRRMLAALGPPWAGSLTDDYLPSGMPGYVDAHLYPLEHPDLKRAVALARGHTRSGNAVMYTCDSVATGCLEGAQTVKNDLKEIGIDVDIQPFPGTVFSAKSTTRGEAFDLVFERLIMPWVDPYQYVNRLLDGRLIRATENQNRSFFNSARYNRLIDQAGSLSGDARYKAYGRLAVDIARDAAPMAAVFVRNTRFFVSSRVGCVRASAHGLDLAGLCLN